MKTCQITCVHKRYDNRIFKKVAVSLAKNGYESHLLCVDNLGNEIKDGVIFTSINFQPKNKIQRITGAWKRLKKPALEINADIYQLHDPELLPLAKFLKKHNKHVIFDSHEDYQNIAEKSWIPKSFRKIFQKIYLRKERKILSKIDGVISVTPSIVDRLSKINPNCIMITNYPVLVDKYDHDFSSNYICFGGDQNRSHKEIIQALDKLNGLAEYQFVTRADSKVVEDLKTLPGWKYVHLYDLMPFDDLRNIYKKSSIGIDICPYRKNMNGNVGSYGITKLYEFMAESMPVICTDFIISKQIIEKYQCGICVNPYDVEAIANAIKTLIENKELAKEMGKNGRIAAEKEFNWGIQEKKLIEFYTSILNQ